MSGNKENLESVKKRKFFNPDNNILKNGYRTRARDKYFKITFFGGQSDAIRISKNIDDKKDYKDNIDDFSNFDRKKIQEYKESLKNQEASLDQILNFKNYYNKYNKRHIYIPIELFSAASAGAICILVGLAVTPILSGIGAAFLLPAVVLGVYLLGIIAIDMKNRMARQNELKECLSVIENNEKKILTQDISKKLKSETDDLFFDYLAESCFNIEHTDDQQKIINILQNSAIIAGNLNIKSKSRKAIVNWQCEICDKILQSEMSIKQMLKCLDDLKINEEFVKNNNDILDKQSQDDIKKLLSIKEVIEIMNDFEKYKNDLKTYSNDKIKHKNDFEEINHISYLEKYINNGKALPNSEYESKLTELQEKKSSLARDYININNYFNNNNIKDWLKNSEEYADSFNNTPMISVNLAKIIGELNQKIDEFKRLQTNEANLPEDTTTNFQEQPKVQMVSEKIKESLLTHYKEHIDKINQLNSELNSTSTKTSQRLDG